VDECKPLPVGRARGADVGHALGGGGGVVGRGLQSFPFQLNLSSTVHRMTQLDS